MKSDNKILWTITLKALWRRKFVSFLLIIIVLISTFSAYALHRVVTRQEKALADLVANSRIKCTVTDAQGMNADNLKLSYAMVHKLTGEYENEAECLDEYVTDVNAMSRYPLVQPDENHSVRCILSFDSDPDLSEVEGAKIELYDGWDESVLRTDQRVCLIPAYEKSQWPDGTVSVALYGMGIQKLTIIGTVTNGPHNVYYVPLNMTWYNGADITTIIRNCSFAISDNSRLDEYKAALYEVFMEPQLSKDPESGLGLIIDDEMYLATWNELNNNTSRLRIILPVVMSLVGCIGFFASYMTTRSRQKEFSVMRCIGMSQRKIFSIVFFEQTVLALIGGGAGIGVGWVIDGVLESNAHSTAALVTIVFLIGAAIATIRVTSVNVMKLMKVED